MRVVTLASGSTGNCTLVSDRGSNILIDAGISMRRISLGLAACGIEARALDGVLITHEHSDHISGLGTLVKKLDVPVYAPAPVLRRLARCPGARREPQEVPVGSGFRVGELLVRAFRTPHDAEESLGYRIEGDSVFALATDMGSVTEETVRGLGGADIALIEANHDEELLKNGPYPACLKKRILSPRGHLSNADCAGLAAILARSGTRYIILGHLSAKNNTPERALETVRAALPACGVSVFVAPEDGPLSLETEGDRLCSL